MNPQGKAALRWSLITLALGLIAPSLIILVLEVFVGGIAPLTAVGDILHRQFAEGHNLFLLAAIGLIPFVVLSIVILVAARKLEPRRLGVIAVGGLVGILTLMVPMHVSIWYPLYGDGHAASTAVIGFLLIPFYCLVSLAVGLIIGWHISRLPYFRGR